MIKTDIRGVNRMKWLRNIVAAGMIFALAGQLAGCSSTVASSTSSTSGSSAAAVTSTAAGKDPTTGETYPASFNIGLIEGGPESAILNKENYLNNIDGVAVKVTNYSAGTDINNAVVSGNVDAASFGSSPIALGISNKINYKVIYAPYVEGGNIEALVVKSKENITSVAQLKGKKIAVPFGTTSHYALLNALKLSGLSTNDVSILDMDGQSIVSAWSRGDIDAAYIWSPALDKCVAADGKIILNDGDLEKKGVTIPEIAVARTDFAKKYPTLVSQYVKALTKVYDLVKNNQTQATQDVAAWEGVTTENAKGQITDNIWVSPMQQTTSDYLGTNGKGKLAQNLKTIADFHQAQGDIKKSPNLSTFESAVDTSYLKQALK